MLMAKKRKKRSSRDAAPQHELPGGFWRQVVAVLMILAGLFLVMTWFGEGGSALKIIDEGLFYTLGYARFFIPVILIYLAVKIFRAENNRLSWWLYVASFLMIAWLAGIFGIPTIGQANPTGGVLGAGLNVLATKILDPAVVIIIYLALIFITALFVLQISPASVFRAIANMFRTGRREEDSENSRIMRRANETEAIEKIGPIKVNNSMPEAIADKQPKIAVKKAAQDKPAAEPTTALMAVSDPTWKMPSTDLLSKKQTPPDGGNIQQNAYIIKSTLADFDINVEVEGANVGPRVTQYTMRPPAGVNLSKITARDKELALNLAVEKVRIEAPIPGTRLVGIEIPNVHAASVTLRSLLESDEWKKESSKNPLTFAVGKDITGHVIVTDLAKTPHLLIAGTTGSGKSVMTNILISSLLYHNSPSDLKLIIVDPKRVEMVQYKDIPHLLAPIISTPDKALSAMKWAVDEMLRRYDSMAEAHVKNIIEYNEKMAKQKSVIEDEDGNKQEQDGGKMPYIVIIIDEMADLMMAAGKDLESMIVRIAQMGRAAGIHMVLATQRPVVKVITGLIKGNVPSRIAFTVSSNADSRIILDQGGAEKLLGRGDMLMSIMGDKPTRIQGAFASNDEVEKLTNFLREQRPPEYNNDVISQSVQIKGMDNGGVDADAVGDLSKRFKSTDPLVRKAVEITINQGKFSTASLMTYLGKGHGWVSGMAIYLEQIGAIGPANGNKPRDVLISSLDEFDELVNAGR